jgi:mono/diheme cytochrome c family protein
MKDAAMKSALAAAAGIGFLTAAASGIAQDKPAFPPEQIKQGAALYAKNCESCHGVRMNGPEWATDLKTFPHDSASRFVYSVTNGKNAMPPWGDVLSRTDIDALWAYVVAGEARK